MSRLAPNPDLWRAETAEIAGQGMTVRDLLMSGAFHLASNEGEDAAGPRLSAWGRVPAISFDGVDGAVPLDGQVTTATLGIGGT